METRKTTAGNLVSLFPWKIYLVKYLDKVKLLNKYRTIEEI